MSLILGSGKLVQGWCARQGEQPALGRIFNRVLEERGLVRKRALHPKTRENAKHWVGLRIKLPYEDDYFEQNPVSLTKKDRLSEVLQ